MLITQIRSNHTCPVSVAKFMTGSFLCLGLSSFSFKGKFNEFQLKTMFFGVVKLILIKNYRLDMQKDKFFFLVVLIKIIFIISPVNPYIIS